MGEPVVRRRSRLLLLVPPVGAIGDRPHRLAALAGDLVALGHEPTLVTGPDGLAPERVRIARVPGPVPTARSGRAARWLDRPARFARWWCRGAAVAAAGLVDEVDAIVAALPPYEAATTAAQLAQLGGIPWIADLRAPWALDEAADYPSALHRQRDTARMAEALRTAHAIVVRTPSAQAALLGAFPELALKDVAIVPDAFDADDFPPQPQRRRAIGPLRVVHVGAGRGPTDILAALAELRDRELCAPGDVELHLAGAAASPVGAWDIPGVATHGDLGGSATAALLRSADLLSVALHDVPRSGRSHVVPPETYNLLAAGRPILAALPPGDARDLVAGAPEP